MTPALRLACTLVLSLLVWLPTVPAALAQAEDPARIALRYLIGLIVCRIGVGLVFRVVNGYVVDEVVDEPEPEPVPDPLDGNTAFGRRHDDLGGEYDVTAEELLDDALEDVAADHTAMVQ